MRNSSFAHRFLVPDEPDGSVIVLLHGTGGDESDLMPLAGRLEPHARLLGVRGRSHEEGINRWFRRFDPVTYDQDHIRAEAAAFVEFIASELAGLSLDPARTTYLGYSNGANLLGAILRLHPGAVRQAILLRGIEVLERPPTPDLTGTRVLLVTGSRDPFGRMVPALEASLKAAGVELDSRLIEAGHELSAEDLLVAGTWLHG